jgi:glyceraldehyde 3-phosphate dehydrogenase
MIKVAINGMGRIGRTTMRQLLQQDNVTVVAVNDLVPQETLVQLIRFDSVYGRFPAEVTSSEGTITIGDHTIQFCSQPDPSKLPWQDLDVDVVLDCTGLFKTYDKAAAHLEAGAKKVVLSYPVGDDRIKSTVLGVNHDLLTSEDKIVSNASCTTNCSAPVVKILNDQFGIKRGVLNTIHAYTADQRINDSAHSDMRRARAAAVNIIPTSTGAAKALGKIIPSVDGKIAGSAYRVPVITGSCVDLVVELDKDATAEEINAAVEKEANGKLKGVLEYSTDPLVSSDIVANPSSSIFDSELTTVQDGLVKVVCWYDNEFGYSTRMAELCSYIAKL